MEQYISITVVNPKLVLCIFFLHLQVLFEFYKIRILPMDFSFNGLAITIYNFNIPRCSRIYNFIRFFINDYSLIGCF